MAYDEILADRVRGVLSDEPIVEKRMFGGLAFLLRGNMSVAASTHGGLLVRVHPDAMDELLTEPGAETFEMAGRGPVKGWLRVEERVLEDDSALEIWVRRGLEYAATLRPK